MQVECTKSVSSGQWPRNGKLLRTEHTDHTRLYGAKRGPLAYKLGAGFTSLPTDLSVGAKSKVAIKNALQCSVDHLV